MEIPTELFFDRGKYVWSKAVLEGLFSNLEQMEKSNKPAASERCFVKFHLELERAYNDFLQDLKDLPLIINCRAKGNSTSHFGGSTCLKLINSFVASADKYLSESKYSQDLTYGSPASIAKALKEKSVESINYARQFESKANSDYNTLGIDNTLKIFRESGYKI